MPIQRAAIEELLAREDHEGLKTVAVGRVWRVLRVLIGKLYGDDKWLAVRALGALIADTHLVSDAQARELMRRFLWALNDESGAVPFGFPEAMGEMLVQRPGLRAEYLPILCSLLTSPQMSQTGDIERGVVWALGRVGPDAVRTSPAAAALVEEMAASHPDRGTRELAAEAHRSMCSRE
jgi:hypothetical protein